MHSVSVVFPHQLFKQHPAIKKGRKVIITEEWLFFKQYSFHKQKLILHRASMQFYREWLEKKGYDLLYIETADAKSDIRKLIEWLNNEGCKEIHYADVSDDWLRKRITAAALKNNIKSEEYASPCFINTLAEAEEFFNERKTYFQTDFYIWQRKKQNILLASNKLPEGGKWSFDSENRKKFPLTEVVPEYQFPGENTFTKEAKQYIEKNFYENYGALHATAKSFSFNYPVTFQEAENWLNNFIENRFQKFGIYEDAIVKEENFLYHSVLSMLLNIGLLTPQHVIATVLQNAAGHNIPINSLEGFIRQILGWREFIRIVYEREGSKQRTKNYWHFSRKIPPAFWKGETGILPLDSVIKKVLNTGYSHHIERLMIVGQFFSVV